MASFPTSAQGSGGDDQLDPGPSSAEPVDPPGAGLDLQDPQVVIDLFGRACQANLDQARRRGATVHLPQRHKLLMTGDLHDHGLNFQRICKLAALHLSSDRHLVLHEIVHGPDYVNGRDVSVRILARIAALKLQYPDQVHLLQANHELAQLGGEGISKDGIDVVAAFNQGIQFIYSDRADEVAQALSTFIRSLLLAVRCPNGIFCSHSVPSPRALKRFDHTVIDRVPTDEDLAPQGSAYDMVWGRNHTDELADQLAGQWEVEYFVMGHQPAEMGYEIETHRMLVLASDHSHGTVLPISTSRSYDMDAMVRQLVPLASVVL